MANRYIGARQESTQVNGCGLQSANYIQRARQRDDPGNKLKVRNQTTRKLRMTKTGTMTNMERLGMWLSSGGC